MTDYVDEGSYVRYVYQGQDGSYYIGFLRDGGLGIIEPNSKETKYYKNIPNDKTSISSNRIRYINEDSKGNIWIGTSYGLNKYDPKTKVFKRINGLNAFYSEDVNSINNKSKVIFDGFKVNDKDYLDINGLKFDNNTENIKIKFFTPVYSSNKNISYEYELIGSNSSKATTKENYVIYNDLLPGKYTFKVRAVDSRGDISDSETMEFSIKYPFWMSPIACFIYLVIAIS